MKAYPYELEERVKPPRPRGEGASATLDHSPQPPKAGTIVNSWHIGTSWFAEREGGLERYFVDLLQHLPQAGVTARGLVVGSADLYRDTGGLVRSFAHPGAALPVRLWRLRRAARDVLADQSLLLVSHFALYAFPMMSRLGHRPMVVHFHGPWAEESASEGAVAAAVRLKHMVERAVYNRGRLVITLSRAAAAVLESSYRVSPERIRVIAGGVASPFFVKEAQLTARERLNWPSDRPIVLIVRRLTRRMGLENVIAAAAHIRRRINDVLLIIAGRGPLAGELQARVQAAGLSETVRLVGFIPDPLLPYAYRAADVTLVPSTVLESFGLAVIESLAAGTPVLVTPVGGLPETVERLNPECILPESSARAIACGTIGALDGSLRLPSSEECTRFARERYHWPVVASQVSAVYAEAFL